MPSNPLERPVGSDTDSASLDRDEPSMEDSTPTPDALQPVPPIGELPSGSSDRLVHALFEAAMDAMVLADDQGHCRAANRAACELLGVTREDLLGHRITDFVPPGFELGRGASGLIHPDRGELTLTRGDGTVRAVEYVATANVRPHHHLWVLRDVTEQKHLEHRVQQLTAELEQRGVAQTLDSHPSNADRPPTEMGQRTQTDMALSHQLQRLQRLIDALPVCISYMGGDRRYRYVNQTYQTWFNLRPADIIGRPLVEVIGDAAYAEVKPYIDRVLAGESVVYEATVPYAQGGVRHIQGTLVPDVDDQGAVQGYYGLVLDWSDRQQAELALRESEARFAAAFQSSPDAILITRLQDGFILDVNAQFVEISGYTRTEAIGQTTLALALWSDPAERVAIATHLQTQRTIQNYEISFRRKSGEQRVGLFSCQVLDLGGQPCLLSVVRDISDRKQVEATLQDREERLRIALEAARMGNWDWNILTHQLVWSESLERLMGLQPGMFDGHFETFKALIYPADRQRVEEAITRALEQGDDYDIEFRFVKPDGCIRWAAGKGNVLRDASGRAVRMAGVDVDITDRKQAELTLKESETRFLELSDASPANIYILVRRVDGSFYFEHISQAIEVIHEIGVDQILETPNAILDCIHPEDRAGYDAAARRSVETLQPFHHEWRVITPSGAVKWLQGNSRPRARDNGEIAWYGVVTDITDLKQAQNALIQQSARERSLRLITQHIRETLDLNDVLATAVTEVQRILQVDRALIFRFNSDGSGEVLQESVRPGYPITLGMHWENRCFPEQCYAAYSQGQVRIIPDILASEWSHCLMEFIQQTAAKSKIVASITQSQEHGPVRLWGWLVVHACGERRLWHPDEADVLKQVADQLAIAIHQAELYSQVQQLNVNLEQQVQDRTADLQQALDFEMLLQRITDQVRDSLDEDQILDTAVRELGQGLQLECCDTGIYNTDLTTSTITHEFTRSLPRAKGTTLVMAEASHTAVYPVLFQGQSVQFCDRIPCPLRPTEFNFTILACPILDNQRVLGDMWLYKSDPFSPSEVRLVQQVAKQCAIALRQSRLYQSVQAQVRELEQLNHLKDDFLSTVSHELRTPIASIKMAIQMLEICLQPTALLTDESQRSSRYFHILKTECQREIQLINDLLDLTHLDAGTEPLNLTSTDLRFLIPHIAEPFLERVKQHQQHLDLTIPEDLPPITTDLFYLERIVTELLNNACKYTPAGERIGLSIHATASRLHIAICNSGVEIAAPERDRIFEKFYRIPNNDPWKYGGTGLGLALVKKLTERLGGTIHVDSCQGQTMFSLDLELSP